MRTAMRELRLMDSLERLWLLGNVAGFLTLAWLVAVA